MKIKGNLKNIILQTAILGVLMYGCEEEKPKVNIETGEFTDLRDDQTYKTVKIGNQTWFAENLNYKTDSGSWVYDVDSSNADYGRLYNWETACNVCPEGWHLPSDPEWTILIKALGGVGTAGGQMKETDTITYWKSPNEGATNESEFSVLPAGFRETDSISALGYGAYFWSSTEKDSNGEAWNIRLNYNNGYVDRLPFNKNFAFSVRCIKD